MKIGYVRVSTNSQKVDRQLGELENETGVEKIFLDKSSGKSTVGRKGFNDMMDFAREKDMIIVSSLDRLGRNYDDIKEVLDVLHSKNIKLKVLDAPFFKFWYRKWNFRQSFIWYDY